MPEYRVYKFNDAGHIFEPPAIIQSNDDQEVIGKAMRVVDCAAVEIWESSRLIVRSLAGLESETALTGADHADTPVPG